MKVKLILYLLTFLLEHTKQAPASGPLHSLGPLSDTLIPKVCTTLATY